MPEWMPLALPLVYALGLALALGSGWWARGAVDAEEDRAAEAERALLQRDLDSARIEVRELREAIQGAGGAWAKMVATRDALRSASATGDPADLARMLRGPEDSDGASDSGAPPTGKTGGKSP